MKILIISHSSVLKYHQEKLFVLAEKYNVDITLCTPPHWYEGGVRVEQYDRYPKIKYIKGKVFYLKGRLPHFYFNASEIVKQADPDIVHIEEEPFDPACWQFTKAAKKAGKKVMFFTWENMMLRRNPIYSYFYKYAVDNLDAAIAGNNEGKVILEKMGFNKKIYVMPQYGIDMNKFTARADVFPGAGEKYNVAYAGRLVAEKGIDTLLEAAQGIDNILVHIAGTGNPGYELNLKSKIQNLKLQNVTFHGHIKSENIPTFLAKMHILVLPSLTTKTWKEQFGRILIEAAASNVALIGSDSGEIKNVIGGNGLIFKEGDRADLREKIKAMTANRNLFSDSIKKMYNKVKENYTNDSLAKQLSDIYKTLMA